MFERDDQHLGKLRDTYAAQQVLPAFPEMSKFLGLRSTSQVSGVVDRLKEDGFLESTINQGLRPASRFFDRVFITGVQAGKADYEMEKFVEEHQLDRYLISEPSRSVVVQVKGDSMNGAGLLNGDYVIVNTGAQAKAGDIVIAIVDGEYTVKYLAKDKKGYYLKPANKAFKNIRAEEELQIFGRVVGLARKYQ
jgi:repressor LexA